MASQTWVNLLNGGPPWQTTNGTALTSSVGPLTISPQAPTTQDFVLPGQPNGLQFYPGMSLRIRARGTIQAGGTTSAVTMTLAIGASGSVSGATLTASGALTLGTTITTATGWRMDALCRCFAVGSTGTTLSTGGDWIIDTVTGANAGTLGTATATFMYMPETTLAYNTYTGGGCIVLRASASAAFGTTQCNQFTIEQLS